MVNWVDCIFIVVVIFHLSFSWMEVVILPSIYHCQIPPHAKGLSKISLVQLLPMDCSMPGLPVHHQLPESTETHVHWVSVAIQPFHPLKDQAWINPGKQLSLLLSIMERKIKDSLLPSVESFLRLTSLWLGFNLFSMEYLDVIAILHFN